MKNQTKAKDRQRLAAADTGGTFTDVAVYDPASHRVTYGKRLTTYSDLAGGALEGLRETGTELDTLAVLKHGTTHVINALLQRNGARTALVTTVGFRDLVEIGRGNRPVPFALDYRRNPPLVSRTMRFEVDERMDAYGKVIRPLSQADLERVADELARSDVTAVAVSFLNAFANPAHEQTAVDILRQRLPHAYVTRGTQLSGEWYEYERTSTAVANAYVGARMSEYIHSFDRSLKAAGFDGTFYMMGSNGGVLAQSRCLEQPVALVESGPVGGCIGASQYARSLDLPRVIAFDVGGTTAKCALIENGQFEIQPVYYVGGYDRGFPLKTPVLDIVEVGAGGGSIAAVDTHGRLSVGPRSAGSEPGPVAFGRGGLEPTVTDANLSLGRIGTGVFLRGDLRLDLDAARKSIEQRVADPLGYVGDSGVDAAAQGILDLANATMSSAIKEITIERGHDVREFVLFAYGGGGPLFATSLARMLGIRQVIIPPHPGNFSTLGMLTAGARLDLSQTLVVEAIPASSAALDDALIALESAARASLQTELECDDIRIETAVEMRYRGQKHTLRTPYRRGDNMADLVETFQTTYRKRFGGSGLRRAMEIIGVRISAEAEIPRPAIEEMGAAPLTAAAQPVYRSVYFAGLGRVETPVWTREALEAGRRLTGPAVIEEYSSTTIVYPGDEVVIGGLGEMTITCAEIQ